MQYFALLAGYILGSIPFGYLVSKHWKGINILEHGSGNIGFTNVLRTVGWPPALVVLVGDIGKGALAAWFGLHTGGQIFGILCSLAALLGHSFSVFLKFKGGKMVATGFGIFIVLTPKIAIVVAVIWLSTLFIFRYVSLASILAAAGLFPLMFIFDESTGMKVFLAMAGLFAIYRHRVNIEKLIKGQEYKIGQKAERK
ncbi:MAG: glycerol-3-phosphate 1-O-acyltransferase PlsY [Thermincola sp.]|jgi:glycerol-3-phosphate acyltransferase PlsY|nr:glycerol-3-phosphate 1-O-acyltransferase PlsY [Thermincola sp.]MDT3703765.1 glycerol-3-phosphate 1-O-acyltransferase PlsY [Thermincola sp.]